MMRTIAFMLFMILGSLLQAQTPYTIENNEVKTGKLIEFESGTAKLKTSSNEALQVIKKYLDDKSYISLLRVEGHVLATPDAKSNLLLSQQRATAVCMKLIALGVDCKRLIAVGFGDSKPLEDSGTPQGRAANNRINFVNAALKGRPIGGMPLDGGGLVGGDLCN
jgi:OmpA-OmpF porin, OOP family